DRRRSRCRTPRARRDRACPAPPGRRRRDRRRRPSPCRRRDPAAPPRSPGIRRRRTHTPAPPPNACLRAGLVARIGRALVEQRQRDGQRLLGAADDALVGLDALIRLQDLILIARRLLLEIGDALRALVERRLARVQILERGLEPLLELCGTRVDLLRLHLAVGDLLLELGDARVPLG